jgi:hypothetical protein
MLVIQALGKLRQKDNKFKASLSYIARPCSAPPQKKLIKQEKVYRSNKFRSVNKLVLLEKWGN